jgi:hypothetical protein
VVFNNEPEIEMAALKKMQIVKLLAAVEADFEIRGAGANWQIECADRKANALVRRALRVAHVEYHGFLAGHGGWIFKGGKGPQSYQYTCDYGDKASIHHY